MKSAVKLLPLVLCMGCAENSIVERSDSSGTEIASSDVTIPEAITVSFTAGDSATLSVPEMSCAVMCYPKVKETLEGLEGVTLVELVPQKEEGIIDDRRVTVKFAGDVSSENAVAALSEAGYPDSKFE